MKFLRQGFHEALILIGFGSAKLVVKMKRENADPQTRAQRAHEVEQSHGIRAARNAHSNAVSRPDHVVPADRFLDSPWKIAFHWNYSGGAGSLFCMVATGPGGLQIRQLVPIRLAPLGTTACMWWVA